MRLLFSVLIVALTAPAVAQEVKRSIEPVAGDVYLMRNDFHNSLLVATEDGVVRVDPINAEAGEWLNANLGEIGQEKVTHLIYSHSHGDHASGGAAHPDAEVIAHEDAPETIHGVTPDTRVGDTHTLTIGGKTIELVNLGAGHDNHMLVTIVRPENVAFIVDVAAPKRLPFRDFPGADIAGWFKQLEAAQALDFEIFAPGHGAVGNKSDLDDATDYMVELQAAVLEGLEAGKSVDELKAEITLDAYKDWGQYEGWREENITGMARYLEESGQVG
ncbi:MAG: MBL fold metallo-hydrolase [Hyphomicrobiales bacterium]|nr:MBL fold metallo-hydrolase [Hyphomicrobiales bacterium]